MNISNGCVATGQDDEGSRVASDNSGARKQHVDLVLFDGIFVLDGAGILRDALALSGEDGLVDIETIAVDRQNPAVCGNSVADGDRYNIARHQIICLDTGDAAIANDLGLVGRVFLKGGNGLLGARFLRHAHDGVENEDGEDDGRVDKSSPIVAALEQGKHEAHGGATQQDDD